MYILTFSVFRTGSPVSMPAPRLQWGIWEEAWCRSLKEVYLETIQSLILGFRHTTRA